MKISFFEVSAIISILLGVSMLALSVWVSQFHNPTDAIVIFGYVLSGLFLAYTPVAFVIYGLVSGRETPSVEN